MVPENHVLNILCEVPKTGKTVVLVRHADRVSFRGVPENLRDGVPITDEGVIRARAFGESLGRFFPGRRLLLGHTFPIRCQMTAESIRDGYASYGHVRILGCLPEVESVVVNLDRFVEYREKEGWPSLMLKWLGNEIPDDVLQDPGNYCEKVLGRLVFHPEMEENDLLVVIAHDVTVFPIVFGVFGVPVTALEFLNGVVITGGSSACNVRFTDTDHSLKAEWNGA